MRKFIFKNSRGWSPEKTEKEVLENRACNMYEYADLFELVPRTIKTVTKQEII